MNRLNFVTEPPTTLNAIIIEMITLAKLSGRVIQYISLVLINVMQENTK